jgi:aflatoxin B1 aldehyde reductase
MAEAALLWMKNHSELKGEFGDGVIIGASSMRHLTENVGWMVGLNSSGEAADHDELPASVLQAFDDSWKSLHVGDVPSYWRGHHRYE